MSSTLAVSALPVRLANGLIAPAKLPTISDTELLAFAPRMQKARAVDASDRIAKPIRHEAVRAEFLRLREMVASLEPEYQVGGLLNGKRFSNGVELLWKLSDKPGDWEVIRIYRENSKGAEAFDVTFHRGTHMIRDVDIVRRFIGHERIWRADSVDAATGKHLERQGQDELYLSTDEWKVLRDWKIAQR